MDIRFLINEFNKLFPKPPRFTEHDRRKLEEDIVSKYAQGSVSLQLRKYTTPADLALMKEKVLSHTF